MSAPGAICVWTQRLKKAHIWLAHCHFARTALPAVMAAQDSQIVPFSHAGARPVAGNISVPGGLGRVLVELDPEVMQFSSMRTADPARSAVDKEVRFFLDPSPTLFEEKCQRTLHLANKWPRLWLQVREKLQAEYDAKAKAMTKAQKRQAAQESAQAMRTTVEDAIMEQARRDKSRRLLEQHTPSDVENMAAAIRAHQGRGSSSADGMAGGI